MRARLCAALTAIAAIAVAAPASAQTAAATAAVDQSSPSAFIQSLADQTFAVLQAGQADRDRNARFRQMVRTHFAIRTLGDRLIRRARPTITPDQYQAYVAALPDFIVGAYADRLEPYANARFSVIRSVPRGDGADVYSRVQRPGQSRPFDAVWTLVKDSAGRWRVANLTVEGVNLALSQEADFSAKIQRDGFDSLVAFLRERGRPG